MKKLDRNDDIIRRIERIENDLDQLNDLLRPYFIIRDPRSAYAIYDTETRQWEARRVQYNVNEVQQRLREAGLPEKHAVRLGEGW